MHEWNNMLRNRCKKSLIDIQELPVLFVRTERSREKSPGALQKLFSYKINGLQKDTREGAFVVPDFQSNTKRFPTGTDNIQIIITTTKATRHLSSASLSSCRPYSTCRRWRGTDG